MLRHIGVSSDRVFKHVIFVSGVLVGWHICRLDQILDQVDSGSETVDRVQIELLFILLLPPLFLFFTGCNVSWEIFCFVHFPLKSKTVCTVKTAKWATGVSALLFFIYNVQYLVLYKSVKRNGVVNCILTNKNHLAILDRTDSILYSFGTFTIMFLVNSAIVAKFIKAKCKNLLQNSMGSTSQTLNKYAAKGTAMVVTVSVTFIILTAPVSIDQFSGRKLTPYPLFYVFMISMQYLNHSINGVLYCIVGTKFREELLKLFQCRRKTTLLSCQVSTISTM